MAIDLGRWLKDRKREAVDLFDANTAADQQKRMQAGQPRFYQQQQAQAQQQPQQQATQPPRPSILRPQTNVMDQGIASQTVKMPQFKAPSVKQMVDQSYGGGITGQVNKVRDILDANTKADQIKRQAQSGLSENYGQQQKRLADTAKQQQTTRNSVNQFAASGLREVGGFFAKAPGSVGNMYGATMQSENPIVKTLRGAVPGLNAGANADRMVGHAASKDLQRKSNELNKNIDQKIAQSPIGAQKGENKWATGLGAVAGQLPAQLATGGAGLANTGFQMASDEYNKARAAGKSNDEALAIGTAQGIASAASEKLGIDRFLPGNGTAGNMAVKMVKRFLTEGGQEAQQQFTQNLITNKTYNPDQSLSDGVGESFVLGGVSGSAMSPFSADSNVTSQSQKQSFTPEDIQVMQDISEAQMNPQNYTPREQQILQERAIDINNRTGVDLVSGTRSDINERAGQAIENFQNTQQPVAKIQTAPVFEMPDATSMVARIRAAKERVLTPMNEGGYAKIPFGKEVSVGLSDKQLEFINDYANMLEDMGSGNGVAVNTETGTRITNNARSPEIKGKNMSKYDWFEHAREQIESGSAMYGASEDYKGLPKANSAQDQSPQIDTNQTQSQKILQPENPLPDTAPRQIPATVSEQVPQLPSTSDKLVDSSQPLSSEQTAIPQTQQIEQAVQETEPVRQVKAPSSDPKIAQSGFAKRASTNQEVSPELQAQVKKAKPTYETTSDEAHLTSSEEFLKQGHKKAAVDVTERLDAKKSGADSQLVSDAIATVKALDEKGGTGNLQQATDIIEKLSQRLTEAGQTVQAASLLSNRTPQGLYHGAVKTLKSAGVEITPEIQAKLKTKLDAVKSTKAGTPEGDLARFKFIEQVNKLTPSGVTNKGVQLWKAGLLTSPLTTAGNLTANTLEQGLKRTYEDPIAAGVDTIMSVFTGKRSKSLTGRGVLSGSKEGLVKGVSYFKTGYDPRNPNKKFDVREIHYSDKPLGKAAEAYTQSVFKLMGSQDQPFFYASMRNSLYDQAITEAKNAGLKGQERADFVKKFVTEPSKKALQTADNEARYDVFQNETALGNVASGAKGKTGALGDFIIPFSGVPSSIATRIVERTPLGTATEVIKQMKSGKFDQRKMSQAIARGTTGVVLVGIGKALADADDLLTLGFPKDDKERKLWELEGKQPYSIKIGGKWRSLNYFQPAGTLIAAGGEYSRAKKEGASETEAWSRAVGSAGKALTEQSFLKGVSGTLNAVNSPERYASRFLEQTAGSIVPNFIRTAARATDPMQRQINSVGDSIKSGIPGLNQTLDTKVNEFGGELKRRSSGVNTVLNPSRPSDVIETDATGKEVRRLQNAGQGVMTPDFAKNTLGGDTKLNEKQITELQKKIYPEIKKSWDGIIADPRYKTLDDEGKMKALRDASENIAAARKAEYASTNAVGKFAPDYTGKEQKLTYDQKQVLKGNSVDFLTKDSKEEDFNKTPDAEYKYKLAEYEKKKADGSINDIEDIKSRKELAKLQVGSKYDKKARDLYSLSKQDIYDYVTTADDGKKLSDQLLAYDKALKDAGLSSYLKFKNGIAPVAKGGKGKGKGKGGKGGVYDLGSVYTAGNTSSKALASLLAGTTVKAPSVKKANPKKVVLKKVKA